MLAQDVLVRQKDSKISSNKQISNSDQRLFSSLLSILSLLTLIGLFANLGKPSLVVMFVLCVISFVFALFLNIRGKDQLALAITVVSLTALSFGAVFVMGSPTKELLYTSFSWLILPILFSSLFGSPKKTTVLFFIILMAILALTLMRPDISIPMVAESLGLLVTFASLIIIYSNRYQDAESGKSRLSLIVESNKDFICYTDTEGQILYLNQAGMNMIGLNGDSLKQVNITDVIPSWFSEYFYEDVFKFSLDSGSWHGELAFKHKDGSEIPVSATLTTHVLPGGKVENVSFIAHNVSEQKKLNLMLKNVNEQLENLVETLPICLYTCSIGDDYGIEFVSPQVEQVMGYAYDTFIEDASFWLKQIHPEDRPEVLKNLSLVLERKSYQHEYRFKMADGSYKWFLNHLSLSKRADGSTSHIVGAWIDASERKELEAQLKLSLKKEIELGELKSRFIAMASHEYRTPLSIILASANMLQKYEDKLTEADKKERLEVIVSQVSFMTGLLEQVLNVGKHNSGSLNFNPQIIDLPVMCKKLTLEVSKSFQSGRLVDFSSNIDHFEVDMDPVLIKQILTNLLSNALKFSPTDLPVSFKLSCEPENISMQIADQGMGIPADDLVRLFEPFHRAKNASDIGGTGLGLSIVKQNIELHQGTIEVESQLSKGTTFWVNIPINTKNQISSAVEA